MPRPRVPTVVITVARSFAAAAAFGYLFDLWHQTRDHLTNGALRPFGDDFINFWSGAYLAMHGRAATVYDFSGLHAFEQSVTGAPIQFYHYSYPPVLLLLSAPLALVPYVPALFVWLGAGWYAFYRALKQAMNGRSAWLLALAAPAVLINAVGGQNGTWAAALLGGGLSFIERRPYLAGSLFGLMIFKPQLGLLLPVALVAGRQWRVFAAATATAGLLLALSVVCFVPQVWIDYAHHVAVLRQVILEDGTGVWYRMVSVFVSARRLGASVEAAYIVQAAFGVAVCIAVAAVWFKDVPAGIKNAVLLLGTCLATPYLQDYDLVFGALVAVWLWQQPVELYGSERTLQIASGLFLLLPLVAAALGHLTHLAWGPLFILPLFVLALHAAFAPREAFAAVLVPDRA